MARTFIRAAQLKSADISSDRIAADAAIELSKLATNPLARANHTGTQSADTVVDGTTNKAYTADEQTKLAGIADGATANASNAQLRDRTTHTGEQAIETITDLQDELDAKQLASEKGQANGYAELDGSGKVPAAQLPDVAVGALQYQGTWDATANDPALASGTGTKGYYYKVSDAGTTALDGINEWSVGDWVVFNGTVWEKIDQSEAVASVHGRTGAVVAAAGDYQADEVDFEPAGSLAATDVQAAIEELDTEKAALSSFVDKETPAGDVDGVNDEFTLDFAPVAGSEHVFVNGILQDEGAGNDYQIDAAVITFEAGALPQTNDKVRVSYRK